MVATRTTYNHHKDNLNYYQILSISKTASRDEVFSAYLKSIRETSLDNHGNDHELKLQREKYWIAYKVLSNENIRKSYDQWLVRRNKTQLFIM